MVFLMALFLRSFKNREVKWVKNGMKEIICSLEAPGFSSTSLAENQTKIVICA